MRSDAHCGVRRRDPPSDPDRIAELAVRVAAAAGQELLDRWGTAREVRTKSSETDPVSEADLASESAIRSLVGGVRPDDTVVGEEMPTASGSSGWTWIVDPLDGTVNYLRGLPQWAVSVAVAFGESPTIGIVHMPALGLSYRAVRGDGAFCNGRRLRGSSSTVLATAIVGTGFCYLRDARVGQAEALARLIGSIGDVRISGSAAVDLCAAAEGRLDAYCETGLAPYDYAAGALVAAEAGLDVVLPHENSGGWLVAAPPALSASLQEAVRRTNPAEDRRRPTVSRGNVTAPN
jgi:fructose-1,6-bisphosphatase/inositol monophosphatase family enzyme